MVSAVKVFKKSAPNGKITVYLGRRDFVDNTVTTTPVEGVVVVDNDYLQGRNVYAQVNVTYRFGREEDEVMGLNFSKDLTLASSQIFPSGDFEANEVQDRLIKKLGPTAHPFSINLPREAPLSVQLQCDAEKPLGVIYNLNVYVADDVESKPHKRNSVSLAVRKVQYSPSDRTKKQPSTLVSKGFTLSSGRMHIELTLDKDVFYHGEQVCGKLSVNNTSKKTCKDIKVSVIQHVEMTMNNTTFTREISCLQSREGCPITPGSNLQKTITLLPSAATNRSKGGVCLDGKIKDGDSNLASSTLMGGDVGIVVSYSMRVRLNCGTIGGEVVADLPFKLAHSAPANLDNIPEDKIEFEDFATTRRGMSVDMA